VEILDRHDVIGEADVLMLMRDGRLVPGECKLHSSSLQVRDLEKLENLADMLDAPWCFVATLDRASACPDFWQAAIRTLPGRPRFVLTEEHLLQRRVFWALGDNPFEWHAMSEADRVSRNQEFVNDMPGLVDGLLRLIKD
jgi:hypothetical protein